MSENIIGRQGPFSETARAALAVIADATIPRNDALGLPGAGDPEILPLVVHQAQPFADQVQQGVEVLLNELDPSSIPADELVSLLDRDARFSRFYRMLTIAILQAYYQSPLVLPVLGLQARPPFPLGHELEADDWSLLEPVKKRAPLHRPT